MLAIPRVELRNGTVVRPSGSGGWDLSGSGAVQVARAWASAGFQRIHLVDADAIAGTGSNAALIEDVVRDGAVEVQVNGGTDSGDQVEDLASAGALHVVVGPRWLEEPEWLASTADQFPGMLIVATDVRERRVVTRGWVRSLPLSILDVVADLDGLSLAGLLVSSAVADGQRTGADLALIEDISDACSFPVLVGDGVHELNDLRALEHRGVAGVLLGDALYRGDLDARGVAMEFGEA